MPPSPHGALVKRPPLDSSMCVCSGSADGGACSGSAGARRGCRRGERRVAGSAILRRVQAAQATGATALGQATAARARGHVAQTGGHALERSVFDAV